jgi:peptide/nickel transport system permease protein
MVFILLTIVFAVLRVMPGDPVSALLGGHAPESVIEKKKEELGLNRPMAIQYLNYLWQICRLDFGDSMVFKQRVTKAIKEKLPATIELTVFGMIITILLGVLLGAYAADKRRSPQDNLIRLYGIVIFCIPVYWLGLMLQLILVSGSISFRLLAERARESLHPRSIRPAFTLWIPYWSKIFPPYRMS